MHRTPDDKEPSVDREAADEATLSIQLPGDRRAYQAEVELPTPEGWLLRMADPPPALGLVRLHILAPGRDHPVSGQAKVLRVVSRRLAESRGLAPGIRVQLVRPDPELESLMFALAHAARRRSQPAASGPPESPRSRASDERLQESSPPLVSGEHCRPSEPEGLSPDAVAVDPGHQDRPSEPRGVTMPRRRSSQPPGSDPAADSDPPRRQSATLGYDADKKQRNGG